MTGETPKQYTLRLRLERGALRLILLDESILNIAMDCGFSNHETFSRAFRRHFHVSPQEFRSTGRLPQSSGHEVPHAAPAAESVSLSRTVVRSLQSMSVAFIRHTGPYDQVPAQNWDRLTDWARRRRLPEPYVLLGIAWDAPGITQPGNLRFDAAIRVAEPFRSERLVGYQKFDGGLFAFTTNVGPFDSLPAAYGAIFKRIRADRALACVGVPCVEFYRVNRVVADLAIVHTEIGVPVQRIASTSSRHG
jgi:AraC family transcriptional regulator